MSSDTEALREPFYAVAVMHQGTEPDGGDSFSISKKDFNAYIYNLEATLKAEYEEKIREARKQGYIDGIKSDERSTDEVITKSTIKALEDIRMYALDCTFGTSWESKHVEKAVPIKSIESRIEYFKSTLSAQKKELEQDE